MCRSTFYSPRAPLVDEQSATAATLWIACRCPMCARHPTDCAAYLKLGICVRPGVSTEPNPWVSRGIQLPAYGFLTAPDPTMPDTLIAVSPFVVHVGCCGEQCGKSVSKPRQGTGLAPRRVSLVRCTAVAIKMPRSADPLA